MGIFSKDGLVGGFISGVRETVQTIKGAKNIVDGVSSILNPAPGGQQLGSVVAGKPHYRFNRGAIGLGEGVGLKSRTGETLTAASTYPEWLRIQNAYLYYLNSADRFAAPGKVGRTIKV